MDRRNPGWIDINPENQIFFTGNKVYSNLGGKIDKTRIGTILNKNEKGSLFGEPMYTVKFKNVFNDQENINPSCYQSDLVLKMPGEMQDEEGVQVQGAAQGGGKYQKISKKNRNSKHRISKHRISKHRISKHRISKHRISKHRISKHRKSKKSN
jgi:hypothetical protein